MFLNSLRIFPLEKVNEKQLLDFLNKDRVLHIFTIYGLRNLSYMRDKVQVWLAFEDEELCGYLGEFDKRIVHVHGTAESVTKLLDYIDLDEPVLVIEPHHLAVVKEIFEPIEPTDPSSKSKITTYLVMKANAETFEPLIKHRVKKLGTEDLSDVSNFIGEDYRKRVENAIRKGTAFGAYENKSLASLATAPEIIEDLAMIRGVYTVPSLRFRGLATSACSALVEELISLGKEAVIWVDKDNLPARKVYEKIGFTKTEHTLLAFKARRL